MLSDDAFEHLCTELCEQLGYCLSAAAQLRLRKQGISDANRFTETVLRAEGLDSALLDRRAYAQVHAIVRRAFG